MAILDLGSTRGSAQGDVKYAKKLCRSNACLINAQEEERRRIARELHDDFGQRVALLALDLEQLRRERSRSRKHVDERLQSLLERTRHLATDIRRLSHELHPSILEYLGLVPAIRQFCSELSRRYGIQIDFSYPDLPQPIPMDVTLCVYRVVQEALWNVVKHSGTKTAQVDLRKTFGQLGLRVTDTGIGFDQEEINVTRGLGLLSMKERVRLVDGWISITRQAPRGTRVDAQIPCHPENNA